MAYSLIHGMAYGLAHAIACRAYGMVHGLAHGMWYDLTHGGRVAWPMAWRYNLALVLFVWLMCYSTALLPSKLIL